jgi:tetratricopeptide (TPR) repeat protein
MGSLCDDSIAGGKRYGFLYPCRYGFLVPFWRCLWRRDRGDCSALSKEELSTFDYRHALDQPRLSLSTGPSWIMCPARWLHNLQRLFWWKIDRHRDRQLAIALDPNHGIAHFNLGNLCGTRSIRLVPPHFEKALRVYPNYAEAHSNLGQLLVQQGDLEGGMREFRRAIELNPSLSGPYLNLAVALVRQERLEEAVRTLEEALRLAPESAEAHYTLGSVYASQGRYDEAAKAFRDTLQLQRDFAPAHQSLAQLLSLQGKKKEAIQHYEEALRLMRKQEVSGSTMTMAWVSV